MSKKITKDDKIYAYKISKNELAKFSDKFKEVYNEKSGKTELKTVISTVEDGKFVFEFNFGGTQRSIKFPK